MFKQKEFYSNRFENHAIGALDENTAKEFANKMEQNSSEEEEEVQPMEIEDDVVPENEDSAELFVFPEPTPLIIYNPSHQRVSFDINKKLQPTFPEIDPAWLAGIEADEITNITAKRSISAHPMIPMPVFASPVLLYLNAKSLNKIWSNPVANAVSVLVRLKQVSFGIMKGCIPFHPDVTNEMPQKCYNELLTQIKLNSNTQEDRINDLTKRYAESNFGDNVTREECLWQFIFYLEEYTFNLIHLYERYIYQTIIQPHNTPLCTIELSDILTPKKQIFCDDPSVICYVNDFFQTKILLFRARDCLSDVGFDTEQLPYRIEVVGNKFVNYNCPKDSVYKGYIDLLTIYEYWRFTDVDNLIKNDDSFNPGKWRTK